MNNNLIRLFQKILKWLLIIVGIYLAIRLSILCIPFIVAFVLSTFIEPIVVFFEKKLKIPRKLGAAITILLVLSIFGTVIGFIISRLVKEIVNVYEQFPQISEYMQNLVPDLINKVNEFYNWLPMEVTGQIDIWINEISAAVKKFLGQIVKFTTDFAISIPQAIIFIIVSILATFFMTSDKKKISEMLRRQIPVHWLTRTQQLVNSVFSALFGWVRAQLIMMTITFTELIVGFLVMRVENAVLVAIIIAVVDALPILGAGSILIPWGLISLLMGEYRLGLSLLLLYVIVIVVRQLIEPRIIGAQMGIHPLLTLFGMYTGLRLIGVFGIILGPMTIMVLKNLLTGILKNETVKDWITKKFGRRNKAGPMNQDV